MKDDQIYRGIAYACIAFFMFTVGNAINKMLVDYHNPVELAFYRNALCLAPSLIYIFATHQRQLLKTNMPIVLSIRSLIGTVAFMFTFGAAQKLPLADATVLFFTSTLLLPVLAHFILKERIGIHRWIAVFIGMCGVVIVARPTGDITMLGVFLALGAACGHATIQTLIRAMKSENPFTITFYFFLIGTLVPALFLPWLGHMPRIEHIPLLLALGATGGLGQYFLTRGFQMAPASLLGPFNYTGLIWATGLDILIWNYVPGWPVFAGGAIIMCSYLYIIYRERKTHQT